MSHREDENLELVPILLDQETIARLARFSEIVGGRPIEIAGALLRDLLRDDFEAHRPAPKGLH